MTAKPREWPTTSPKPSSRRSLIPAKSRSTSSAKPGTSRSRGNHQHKVGGSRGRRRREHTEPDDVTESSLSALLARLQRGEIDVAGAMAQLADSVVPAIGNTPAAQVDLDRVRRCGYPEVVF